jgi:hypothetical protein
MMKRFGDILVSQAAVGYSLMINGISPGFNRDSSSWREYDRG